MKGKRLIVPIEKRGGMRKPVRRAPTNKTPHMSYIDCYKDTKGTGIFPKRLGECRILICTDLETDDMAALTMLATWAKINETFIDSRNNFPIYGMLVGDTNKRVKAQRAREFLKRFAELCSWNDSEHHLYNGFTSAGNRIWYDGDSDNIFETEAQLVENPDALEDPEYPDPQSFTTTVDELMQVKPTNLYILYLKPLRFFESLADRPEVFEYLRQVPGAMYGDQNIRSLLESGSNIAENINRFLNRTTAEAPLVFVESSNILGHDDILTPDNAPKLFRELDDAEPRDLLYLVNQTMYVCNDNILTQKSALLSTYPEFKELSFEDHGTFKDTLELISDTHRQKYAQLLNIVESILQHSSRQIGCADPLVIIGTLIGSGTLKNSPLTLHRSTIDALRRTSNPNPNSNTYVLAPKEKITSRYIKDVKRLLEGMILMSSEY